jgi:AMP nucleosidase
MKEKKDIVENWLPRYTGTPLAEFGEYVLLTNFDNYVEWFATAYGGLVKGVDRPMPNVTADGITLINFGMGSPNAATVMDLLSAIEPKAVLFLGKCGGLKRKNQIGDLVLRLQPFGARVPRMITCPRKSPRCPRSSCNARCPP